jgi:hypothetical protein
LVRVMENCGLPCTACRNMLLNADDHRDFEARRDAY